MSLVYLYSHKLPVQLSRTNHLAPNYNRPMYNYNVKVYKNNYNSVDFVVRDNDRKPVALLDCTVSVIVQNVETGQSVLEKTAPVTDEIRGRARLIITASETENWLLGGYVFNVRLSRPGGGQEFLYTDTNNSTVGMFELLPAVGGELVPSVTIPQSEFTPVSLDLDSYETWYHTGALAAYNSVGSRTGYFTAVVYTDQWQGWLKIQGSLSNLAPTDKSWFDVEVQPGQTQLVFDGSHSQPLGINFATNVQWIRFVYKTHINNVGKFLRVAYKIT